MIGNGNAAGGRRGPGEDGKTPMLREKKQETRKYDCGAPLLNFPDHRTGNVRSSRRPEIAMVVDAARQLLQDGAREISETSLSERVPLSARRYRATALKAMRLLVTRYPDIAALELRQGAWVLVPTVMGVQV